MMAAQNIVQNPPTLVLGMGVTGLSCARFLQKKNMTFKVIDSRKKPPLLSTFIKEFTADQFQAGALDKSMLQGVDQLIVSPGFDLRHPFIMKAVQDGIQIVGDIELFSQYANAPIVAITGSNGKSTVTTMLGQLLSALGKTVAVGGNLGTAALDLLIDPAPDFYILELSSFQLDSTVTLAPLASVVLNVSEDHMDRYIDIENYALSKQAVYRNAKYCVINKDDSIVMKMEIPDMAQKIFFTASMPEENEFGISKCSDGQWLSYGEEKIFPINRLQVVNTHNYLNVLVVIALAKSLDISIQSIASVLSELKTLPHRCELIREYLGVRWINDSKATNIGSAHTAIESQDTPIVLIVGGDSKGANLNKLIDIVKEKVKVIITLGKDADLFLNIFSEWLTCFKVKDMQEAVTKAADIANEGDTVLLAPACSSLDMYSGYAERGEHFSKLVNALH